MACLGLPIQKAVLMLAHRATTGYKPWAEELPFGYGIHCTFQRWVTRRWWPHPQSAAGTAEVSKIIAVRSQAPKGVTPAHDIVHSRRKSCLCTSFRNLDVLQPVSQARAEAVSGLRATAHYRGLTRLHDEKKRKKVRRHDVTSLLRPKLPVPASNAKGNDDIIDLGATDRTWGSR